MIQFALLNAFLGSSSKYYMYGLQVLEHLIIGSDWEPSERFPRVTLCDFKVSDPCLCYTVSVCGLLTSNWHCMVQIFKYIQIYTQFQNRG